MGLTCSWKVVEAARNQEEENGKSPAGFAPFSKMKNSASNTLENIQKCPCNSFPRSRRRELHTWTKNHTEVSFL
jgi:hypothetical protein